MRILKYVLMTLFLLINISYANFINLNGVETTATGDTIELPGMVSSHTVDCYFDTSGGGVTALTIDLEGSIDNSKWYSLASHDFDTAELAAKRAMIHVVNKPVTYVRCHITTLTETGTTTVYARYNFMKGK